MQQQFRFERVLTVREREEKEAEEHFKDSIESFEQTARKLYHLLKKKETMEESQSAYIQNGVAVQTLRHSQQFLVNIEKSIAYQQKLVMEARSAMQWHEQKLKERQIEVKKYKKIKEKDQVKYLDLQKKLDGKIMDELSVIQFMSKRSR
ncbi:flagellar export protein FliJ [Jeotgalibacillus proteolyticus]|uniref:Flagellar FliJ protein n=1 Tax=Jeotgalibacillus proteolyticus TaxID=2082395 RepID=A0A2S5GGE6_9BACL|nr:flagellar export protein FliJ [Jeotgalibacillus proteolyticus]PPA72056.1 flagellar export protein FliJ [Jeotgalibacillus proteolyticus]